MSKELEVLESTKNLILPVLEDDDWRITRRLFEDYLDIIETALKDYEETDNQLYDLFEKFGINNRKDLLDNLKALEIIKECVAMSLEKIGDVYKLNVGGGYFTISKDVYDLLKEVEIDESNNENN